MTSSASSVRTSARLPSPPTEDAYLQQLADYCGIESEFVDVRGELRKASSGTQRKLLCALGLDADTDEAAKRTWDRLQLTEWEQTLPCVCVEYRERGTVYIPLVLPQQTEQIS